VKLDLHRHRAVTARVSVSLGEREFALLAHLMRRRNHVCSREEVLHDIWDMAFDPGSNVVQDCLRRLRIKMMTTQAPDRNGAR
jgi:DNA-binding response OmpR family regulator